ncbi:MAG: hypothetical protein JKY54_07010, partial [Flavobacteriales bacterium]|nr:hypothetical protein [Flavobacteriales bacterium]
MRYLFLLSFLFALSFSTYAQPGNDTPRKKDTIVNNKGKEIIERPKIDQRLIYLRDSLLTLRKEKKAQLKSVARNKGWALELKDEQGNKMVLVGFDKDSIPIYEGLHNVNAAKSIGSLQARNRYNLDGRGVKVGIWDGGEVDNSHPELSGKVNIKTDVGDSEPISEHATHVAGTIFGKGVDPKAMGMAPKATGFSYNFHDDVEEILIEGTEGLILSNHSYGATVGWTALSGWGLVWMGNPN